MGIVDLLALSLRERQGKRVDDDNLERIDEPAIVEENSYPGFERSLGFLLRCIIYQNKAEDIVSCAWCANLGRTIHGSDKSSPKLGWAKIN